MAERILVVEDDRNILDMLTTMLEGAGYDVIGLGYPDLVLEVVGHERPDLILMDVMLPKRSGIEVADQLWVSRERSRAPSMPIVPKMRGGAAEKPSVTVARLEAWMGHEHPGAELRSVAIGREPN